MNIIDRLAAATLCSKPRAESALKSSTSYEEAVKLVRLLQKQDQLRRHFLDIRRIPVMTPEEEKELIDRLPDPEARERLINANLRFVVSIAKIYQGNGLELMDLISLGNLGLCKSVEYYNKDYNVKFLSYAGWWIKQAIINGLSEDVKPVIAPNVVRHAFSKIKRVVNEYFAQYGTEPDQEYVMEHAKITPSEYSRAMMCFVSFASLSESLPIT